MRRDLLSSVIAIVLFTLLLGVVYPLVTTGVAQVLFPHAANGSLIRSKGDVVGSRLIGQDFRKPVIGKNGKPEVDEEGKPILAADPAYFQERPSTATSYDAAGSSFTNLGPNSVQARETYRESLREYLALERPYDPRLTAAQVPIDAVTSSASGVDPQISQANADIQAHRIATVRHLPLVTVDHLIAKHTEGRFAGIFGEPGVNVLELNLALDRVGGAAG